MQFAELASADVVGTIARYCALSFLCRFLDLFPGG